jgi:L-alanine-DL-glutamate epimerase-like enolase superfamily enzyme
MPPQWRLVREPHRELLKGEPVPSNGFVELSSEPGFGYSLNERALNGEVPIAPIW